jgi:hypothetical protein
MDLKANREIQLGGLEAGVVEGMVPDSYCKIKAKSLIK